MEEASANTYEQERRQKLQKLRDLGVDPFGQRTEGIQPLADVKAQHNPEMGQDGGPVVTVAGRVMFAKRFGKLAFLTLRDETGDLQVALDKKRLYETGWAAGELIDLGDQIVATGKLGATKTGEVTVWATSVTFAAKALLPPPGKWHGLEDVELRYRQRYVDLWANPDVMRIMKLRTRVVAEMRNYLNGLGYTEVETPMMQVLHGGASARPFVTHHNALDIDLYMRIAPELFLKRLLVGGFRKVYEINRNFRNEGISPRHNPEFTMLEAYEAFGSWETMADMVEGLITHVAQTVFGTLDIPRHNAKEGEPRIISLRRPWNRARMTELVKEYFNWDFDKRPLQEANPGLWNVLHQAESTQFFRDVKSILGWSEPRNEDETNRLEYIRRKLQAAAALRLDRMTPAEQLVEVYEKFIEPTLIQPTFVTHVPSVIIPLARPNKDDPFFADVYELAINGQEISPGYTELNDPDVQTQQFARQVGDAEERQKVDEDFLSALRYGMPPAGGMGLGVDRLLMMLTGAESIRDVILFPLMKPQG
ncbi:MAG TPA: lysine--tRNA ligase [Tepidisphaeraceae bacterium]|nr:lysine--tRNA ligase [Tepidisphaeraceae bacterium]